MTKKCTYEGCKEAAAIKRRTSNGISYYKFCDHHAYLSRKKYFAKYRIENREKIAENSKKYHHSIDGMLSDRYSDMKKRVAGKTKYWTGKPLMTRKKFFEWSKNDRNFLKLFKRWTQIGYDQRFTPSVDRIDSNKGYTLDNVQWLRLSDNCAKSGEVRRLNNKSRKEVLKLLGVKNVEI